MLLGSRGYHDKGQRTTVEQNKEMTMPLLLGNQFRKYLSRETKAYVLQWMHCAAEGTSSLLILGRPSTEVRHFRSCKPGYT